MINKYNLAKKILLLVCIIIISSRNAYAIDNSLNQKIQDYIKKGEYLAAYNILKKTDLTNDQEKQLNYGYVLFKLGKHFQAKKVFINLLNKSKNSQYKDYSKKILEIININNLNSYEQKVKIAKKYQQKLISECKKNKDCHYEVQFSDKTILKFKKPPKTNKNIISVKEKWKTKVTKGGFYYLTGELITDVNIFKWMYGVWVEPIRFPHEKKNITEKVIKEHQEVEKTLKLWEKEKQLYCTKEIISFYHKKTPKSNKLPLLNKTINNLYSDYKSLSITNLNKFSEPEIPEDCKEASKEYSKLKDLKLKFNKGNRSFCTSLDKEISEYYRNNRANLLKNGTKIIDKYLLKLENIKNSNENVSSSR